MELKEHHVRVVVTVTERQSPHTQINYVTERELVSRHTTTELLTSVQNAIMNAIKEEISVKMKSENYGSPLIEQLWDTYSNKELSNEEREKAKKAINDYHKFHSSFRHRDNNSQHWRVD